MRNFKKLGLALFVGVSAISLASCSSPCTIKTTDSDGKEVNMSVSPTTDTEEIAQVITALSEEETEEFKYEMVVATVDARVKLATNKEKLDDKFKVTVKSSDLATNVDILATGKNTVTTTSILGTETTNSDLYVKANLTVQDNGVYASVSLSSDATPYKTYASEEALKTLLAKYVPGDAIGEIDDVNPSDLGDLFASINKDVAITKENVEKFVSDYNVTITATTSDTITFTFNEEIKDGVTAPINVTVNPKKGVLTAVSIDLKSVLPQIKDLGVTSCDDCYLKVNVDYKATSTVNKITDTSDYVPFETVISQIIADVMGISGSFPGLTIKA